MLKNDLKSTCLNLEYIIYSGVYVYDHGVYVYDIRVYPRIWGLFVGVP